MEMELSDPQSVLRGEVREKHGVPYARGFSFEGEELERGDIVYWKDVDAGLHAGQCGLVDYSAWVCKVRQVSVREVFGEDGVYSIYVHVTGPLAKLKYEDIVAESNAEGEAAEKIEEFKQDDEAGKYMNWESHYEEKEAKDMEVWSNHEMAHSCWYEPGGDTWNVTKG